MMDSMFTYRSPLVENPPAAGAELDQPLTRKVIIVIVDALRYDTSLNTAVMPLLNDLRMQGASAVMHSRPPSFSAPSWTTILTGAWPDINDGQPLNPPDEFNIRTFTQDDIFAAANRSGFRAAVSGYFWFEQMLANSGVDTGYYTHGEDNAADKEVVDATLPWLEQDYQLVLIHIDQVDYAGHHEGGPRDPRWNTAASRTDSLLGEIVARLKLELDTVIVLSDHGQIDRGGHGGQDPVTLVEPFVIAGAGVKPGSYPDIEMVDVTPTIAALLGTSIPASSQGRVLTGMLNLYPEQITIIHNTIAIQQQGLYNAYVAAIGVQPTEINVTQGGDALVTYQKAIEKTRAIRLLRERLGRSLLALFIAIPPALALYLERGRKIMWLIVGALIYVLLFNFCYAILDGRTYSLSSLVSQEDIITFCGFTAAISLFIAWLIAQFGTGAIHHGALSASETTLVFILVTIYILAIPLLISFSLNGVIVSWTLPDAPSMLFQFLGFISLLQGLVVAVFGLLLVGISALAGKYAKRT